MESTIVSSQASPPGITSGKISQRLLSLDFTRGLIMMFLALEACGLYENLFDASLSIYSSNSLSIIHGMVCGFGI